MFEFISPRFSLLSSFHKDVKSHSTFFLEGRTSEELRETIILPVTLLLFECYERSTSVILFEYYERSTSIPSDTPTTPSLTT